MKVRSSKGFFKLKYIKNILFIIFSLFVIISISGCKSASNYIENELNNIQEIEPYKLKPSDPLIVRFSGINDQAVIELVIDEKGYIRLLHIEPILAINLTTTQLEKEIEQKYIEGEIYKNVSVNILMTAKAYYLQGEVIQSGQFELVSGTTLLQAIATARGYSPYANRKKVTVTRQGKITEYNMKEIEKDPSKDIIIEAGDVIKVWTRWY